MGVRTQMYGPGCKNLDARSRPGCAFDCAGTHAAQSPSGAMQYRVNIENFSPDTCGFKANTVNTVITVDTVST